MAQLALVAVAYIATAGESATTVFLATAAAATAGAIIDQTLVFPALFRQQPGQGPRIDDISIQTASEGSPINYIIGEARSAGTLLWCGPVIENKDSEGGKGGGAKSNSFTYFNSMAIGLCEGPITRVKRIWADSRLIYQDGGFHNLFSWSTEFGAAGWTRNGIVVTADASSGPLADNKADLITFFAFDPATDPKYRDHRLQRQWVDVEPSTEYTLSWYAMRGTYAGGLKYSLYDRTHATEFVSPTDWPTTVDDMSWVRETVTFTTPSDCKRIDITIIGPTDDVSDTGTLYLYGAQFQLGGTATDFEETDGAPAARDGTLYTSINIHLGEYDQTPDPIIEASQGVDQVPGFVGLAYVTLELFALTPFGNRIPQFSFQLIETDGMTADVAFSKLFTRGGLTPAEYDVTAVTPTLIRGIFSAGPTSVVRQLEPLVMATNTMVVESNGVFKVVQKENSLARPIPERVLAAHQSQGNQGEDKTPRKATFTDLGDYQLPSEVDVTYQEVDNDFQRGAQTERRAVWRADQVQKYDLPIVMTRDVARNLAYQLLWAAWSERRGVTLQLPPQYIDMEETDLLAVTIGTEVFNVRVIKLTRGADFILEVKGVIESTQTVALDELPPPPCIEGFGAARAELIYTPSIDMVTAVLDIPALREEDQYTPGIYVAAARTDTTREWRGARVYSSLDTAVGTLFADLTHESAMGTIADASTLGDWATLDVVDDTNTLVVTMLHGTLESVTDDEVLAGKNLAYVGGEVLGFQTATLTGPNEYTLSNFRRGLRNTFPAVAGHTGAGEVFVLLNSWVVFKDYNVASVGTSRYFRGVPQGGSPENYPVEGPLTLTAATLKPFSPLNVEGSRDGSNNLTITWERNARAVVDLSAPPDPLPQLADELHEYELDVMDGVTVLRTLRVSDTLTAGYSAADQTTDGLTPGDPVTLNVYQLSSVVGRGFVTTETV